MPLIIALIIIISAVRAGMLLILRSKKPFAGAVTEQEIIVNQLFHEIDEMGFKVVQTLNDQTVKTRHLTLKEISLLDETDDDLTDEGYDEAEIIFSGSLQIIEFEKYLTNKNLPRIIREELIYFYNSKYTPVQTEAAKSFTIYLVANNTLSGDGKFFQGDGEAFHSWQSLQECAGNLLFVITQWLSENCSDKIFIPQRTLNKKEV